MLYKTSDNINRTNQNAIQAFHRIVHDYFKKSVYFNDKYTGSFKIFKEMIKYILDDGYKTISSE